MSLAQLVAETGPVDAEYLQKITKMPFSMLETELASLSTSISQSQTAQQSLAVRHQSVLVSSQHAMDAISDSMRELNHTSASAAEHTLAIPKLPEKAYAMLRACLNDEVVVYQQIDQIQELLSLPELVRDSVMNADFASALDLAGTVDRLQARFPSSKLITQVREDVQKSIQSLQNLLLKSLRQSVRLPQLTRAIAFLRRLQVPDLEQRFISSRASFVQHQWDSIPPQLSRSQPLAFLKRVVDIYREHVFATINGFQTIFKTETAVRSNPNLAKFARDTLATLLALLRTYAPQILDRGDRASLWLQLAFCAQSLGRIECDFWPFLDEGIMSKQEWEEATSYQQDMARRARVAI